MTELSFGAKLAWKVSAQEATAGKYSLIESEHLLIGICILEKIRLSNAANDLNSLSHKALQTEIDTVDEILTSFELD